MSETNSPQQDQATQAPRRNLRERGVKPASELPESAPEPNGRNRPVRPVRVVRLGRIRAAIWANQTDSGTVYNTTFERLFKRERSDTWESSDSFGTNDLLLLGKVADQAHTWICQHRGYDD